MDTFGFESMIFWMQCGFKWIRAGYKKRESIKKSAKVHDFSDVKMGTNWMQVVVVSVHACMHAHKGTKIAFLVAILSCQTNGSSFTFDNCVT